MSRFVCVLALSCAASFVVAAEPFPRESVEVEPKMMATISNRQQLMHLVWLSEIGHLRPGVKTGLPIEEAKKKGKGNDRSDECACGKVAISVPEM